MRRQRCAQKTTGRYAYPLLSIKLFLRSIPDAIKNLRLFTTFSFLPSWMNRSLLFSYCIDVNLTLCTVDIRELFWGIFQILYYELFISCRKYPRCAWHSLPRGDRYLKNYFSIILDVGWTRTRTVVFRIAIWNANYSAISSPIDLQHINDFRPSFSPTCCVCLDASKS